MKKLLSLIISVCLIIGMIPFSVFSQEAIEVWDGTVATGYSDFEGSGTQDDPYLIENGAQLAFAVSKNPNLDDGSYFKLTKDIILNDTSVANWKDVPTYWIWNNHKRFNGTLDGDGHIIEGLYMNSSSTSGRIGLIAYAGKTSTMEKVAEIKNIYFKGASITSTVTTEGVGIVVGQTSGETHFENIYIDETSEIIAPYATGVGAIAARGYNNGAKAGAVITNCAVHANIIGKSAVGAFTGTYWAADAFVTINGSYTTANYPVSGNKIPSDSENNYGPISYEAGTTVITADAIKGNAAKTAMSGLDFDTVWQTVENGYPVQRIFSIDDEYQGDEEQTPVRDGWDGSTATSYDDFMGSGTEEDPYLIENGAQLAFAVSTNPNLDDGSYFKLTQDIVLNDTSVANWKSTAIPWVWSNHKRFNATLDGDGHIIEGLYMNSSSTTGKIGLISYAGKTSSTDAIPLIKNLYFKGASITSTATTEGVGIVVGQTSGETHFKNIYIDETSEINAPNATGVGAIAARGYNNGEKAGVVITNCAVHANIIGKSAVGAFTGTYWASDAFVTINGSYTTANYSLSGNKPLTEVSCNNYGPISYESGTEVINAVGIRGEAAKTVMSGLNFDTVWDTVENGYPVQKIFTSGIENDEEPIQPPAVLWDGTKDSNLEGMGTEEEPYLIKTPAQLAYVVSTDLTDGLHFKLANDIKINDTSAANWKLYAKNWVWADIRFVGVFDGDGHTIDGLYFSGSQKRMGLFSYVGDSLIKNINFTNAYIIDSAVDEGVSILVGQTSASTNFENIYIDETCLLSAPNAKGVAAIAARGQTTVNIKNSAVLATVTGASAVGAFVGLYWGSAVVNINNCFTASNVGISGSDISAVSMDGTYATVSDIFGTIILTKEQMKGENAKINMPALDFRTVFETVDGSYPVMNLREASPEEPAEPVPDYVWDGTAAESFAWGTGTEVDPYVIETPEQLYKMVVEYSTREASLDKYFALANDIYLNDVADGTFVNSVNTKRNWLEGYTNTSSKENSFAGCLNGNNHTIYGLYVKDCARAGLFPTISSSATFKNLAMENVFILGGGSGYVGALAGRCIYVDWRYNCKFSNCSVVNAVIGNANTHSAGGFVGNAESTSVRFKNCYSYDVTLGGGMTGGLIANAWSDGSLVALDDCYCVGNFPIGSALNSANCTDIYTDTAAPEGNTTEGINVLNKEIMKGKNAEIFMSGLDFNYVWETVDGGYPKLYINTEKVWDGTKAPSFAGGTGTLNDPYLIENGGQLYKMVEEYSKYSASEKPESLTHFKIIADIDLGYQQWYTINVASWIDNSAYSTIGFRGVIDGGGHTIIGLYNDNVAGAVGLIPVATQGTEIRNLHLNVGKLPKVNYQTYAVGAFIGLAKGASDSDPIVIKGCSVKNFEIGSANASAAFVGYAYSQSVGIYNCSCTDTTFYTTAETSANSAAFIAYTGGNNFRNNITIANSYCVDVSAKPYLNENFAKITTIENVYTNVYDESFDVVEYLDTEEMMGENAKTYMSGLDFERYWQICDEDYPVCKQYIAPDYVWDGSKAETFAGGTGTEADPYLIENGAQLYKMVAEFSNASSAADAVNTKTYFKLINDIYLNDVLEQDLENPSVSQWNANFNSWYKVTSYSNGFCGDLDGAGYTVYGLYSNGGYSGLIPVFLDGGRIHNLNIKNSYVYGTESAGGIVGFAKNYWKMAPVAINNCSVDNLVIESENVYVGGFVGGYGDAKVNIANSFITNTELISTNENSNLVSGFVGKGWGATKTNNIINCYTDSSVHPVTKTTDEESFNDIFDNSIYINVYTSAEKNFDANGVIYLAEEQMKGEAARTYMSELNYEGIWETVDGAYPVISANVGSVCAEGHTYLSVCEECCIVCQNFRVAPHARKGDCSSYCPECKAYIPSTAEHQYDNACDSKCNVCETIRVPADHVYDNDYDINCNVCGNIREVPPLPEGTPKFSVTGAKTRPGKTFTVDVSISDNPGICSFGINVEYDSSKLELVSSVGGAFVGTTFGPTTKNPFMISWVSALSENTTNGVVATLTFKVKEDAPLGKTAITLSYDPNNVYDFNFENVHFETESGIINIIDYTPGDVNDDGAIDNKDVGLLSRFVNGWDEDIKLYAADVNRDGLINNRDIGIIQRYICGWDVELK